MWYIWVPACILLLVVLYFVSGIAIAWGFLRRKPKTEEQSIAKERRYHITDEELFYRCEEMYLVNKRGIKMFARIYKTDTFSDKWVLVLHGYNSNGMSVRKYGKMFNDLGYNVLSPDFCFCGRSEGKFFSFGNYETQDAEFWLDYMEKTFRPNTVGVFGVSMGGSSAIMLTSRHPEVDFLIPYCPYYSYKREIIDTGKKMVGNLFILLWPSIRFGTYIVAQKTKSTTLYISKYLHKVTCPTLLLHSKEDDVTSYFQSVLLHEENPHTSLHLFEKGVHAKAYSADRKEYIGAIANFLQSINKNK